MSLNVKRFRGGIHPTDGKSLTASKAILEVPLLEKYYVITQQHIGVLPSLIVKNGDKVKKGQMLADKSGFISASVHSPTSGTIKIGEVPGVGGKNFVCVEVTSDGDDVWEDGLNLPRSWESLSLEELKDIIVKSGIVGMGGAAFPTHVKLSPPDGKNIDTLILNGAECEPFLTADHRLMLESPEKVLIGARILAKILNVKNVAIGIEENKKDAILRLKESSSQHYIEIFGLHVKYPQGAEKQLIYALTGREVPCGGLPMDAGCVVQNVGTAAAVYDAVCMNRPLIERITTVTGSCLCNPGNWKFRIGTPLSKVLEFAGGIKKQPAKILFGGPMMGQAVYSLDIPIMKSTSGILLLSYKEVAQFSSHPCIRCGRCVDICPMNLLPGTLSVMIESEKFEMAEYENVMDCIECGSCAYVCPAVRPLVQHMKRGKMEVVSARKLRMKEHVK